MLIWYYNPVLRSFHSSLRKNTSGQIRFDHVIGMTVLSAVNMYSYSDALIVNELTQFWDLEAGFTTFIAFYCPVVSHQWPAHTKMRKKSGIWWVWSLWFLNAIFHFSRERIKNWRWWKSSVMKTLHLVNILLSFVFTFGIQESYGRHNLDVCFPNHTSILLWNEEMVYFCVSSWADVLW